MNVKKILLILMLILSVTIVGEFYYLFIVKTAASKSSITQTDTIVGEKMESVPSSSPSPLPTTDPDQAFNEGVFVSLRRLKKGMVTSSILTYVLEGNIDRINYLTDGEKRAIDVTIKAKNGDINSFRFPGTELVTVKNSSNDDVDLFAIKQNDPVVITIQFDMIKIDYQNIVIRLL